MASLLLIYLPISYCRTSSCTVPSIVRPNTAMSDPLLTYLHKYLMDFTEWQYSTLMCALNIRVRSGQHGTIHLLSTSISQPRTLMVVVNPPFSGFLRRYSGYPSCPVCLFQNISGQVSYGCMRRSSASPRPLSAGTLRASVWPSPRQMPGPFPSP